jgi:hypothetical protein
MREIKFRGWWRHQDGGAREPIEDLSDRVVSDLNEGHFIIEQFTGVTHKKGGELYIGDKVRVFGEREYSSDQFSTGRDWSIEGDVCEICFMIGVNFGMLGFMPLAAIQGDGMDFEIIGNIHGTKNT